MSMEKRNPNEYVLEPSTNTHKITSTGKVDVKDLGNSILKLKIEGSGIVTHGEHGVIKTESPDVIKYVQQEVNPLTKRLQNAFD